MLAPAGYQAARPTLPKTGRFTGPEGLYEFDDLCRGRYEVIIDESTLPAGMVATLCNVGSDAGVDSNCSPVRVFLGGMSTVNRTLDFGFIMGCSGRIGVVCGLTGAAGEDGSAICAGGGRIDCLFNSEV